jgi:hypothetical protein
MTDCTFAPEGAGYRCTRCGIPSPVAARRNCPEPMRCGCGALMRLVYRLRPGELEPG